MNETNKPPVLIVDDDSMLREMLRLILQSEDYRVVGEASNGQDAVMQCVKPKPDLVLLDINMPKMDGLQALQEIRIAYPAAQVMMSAEATLDRVKEAMHLASWSNRLIRPAYWTGSGCVSTIKNGDSNARSANAHPVCGG